MNLTNKQLFELKDVAIKAARAAGDIIRSHQGRDIQVNSKAGGENIASCVVTEVDIAAEKAILSHLNPTLNPYKLGLLTEESLDDNSRFNHDYFWCIDPLDGTLSFSRNEDGYSTSIALIAKDGTPIIGVVFNPRNNTLYHAIKDQGAFQNDKKLTYKEDSDVITLLYDQSFIKHKTYDKQIEFIKEKLSTLGYTDLRHHHLGGAVMNGISTILLGPALYYKFPKKADGGGSIWDFAASSVIQKEAGGFNSDFFREPLNLNRKESTFMNKKGVIYTSSKKLLEIIPNLTE